MKSGLSQPGATVTAMLGTGRTLRPEVATGARPTLFVFCRLHHPVLPPASLLLRALCPSVPGTCHPEPGKGRNGMVSAPCVTSTRPLDFSCWSALDLC